MVVGLSSSSPRKESRRGVVQVVMNAGAGAATSDRTDTATSRVTTMPTTCTSSDGMRKRIRPTTTSMGIVSSCSRRISSLSFLLILCCCMGGVLGSDVDAAVVVVSAEAEEQAVTSHHYHLRAPHHGRSLQQNTSGSNRPPEQNVSPAPIRPPTNRPTNRPTAQPTDRPITRNPTPRPTRVPTEAPTFRPTRVPTVQPTNAPTEQPTFRPTRAPTNVPTRVPTNEPTREPTRGPTDEPTQRPTVPPTLQPTNGPTAQPTNQPSAQPTDVPILTDRPTSLEPTTAVPTARRTQAFFTRGPTQAPIAAESPVFGSLTERPTRQPVRPQPTPITNQPTNFPVSTQRPTDDPAMAPSRRPTVPPVAAPAPPTTFTLQPVVSTTTTTPTVVATAQRQVLERLNVPIDFEAVVTLPPGTNVTDSIAAVNVFSARVAGIWERFLGTLLREQALQNENVQWLGIDLTVVPETFLAAAASSGADDGSVRRLKLVGVNVQQRRRLQQDEGQDNEDSIRLVTSGNAGFEIDANKVNRREFLQNINQVLDDNLTTERLQGALASAGNTATVSGVTTPEDETSSGKPSTVELVFGFLLLVLTLASLAFWGVILWRKRQKKKASRRQSTAVSKKRSRTIVATPPRPIPAVAKAETSSDGSSSSYKGIGSDDDGISDPFGRELEQAASLDQAAWTAFQHKKKSMERQGRVFSTPERSAYGAAGGIPMYGTPASQEGVEVDMSGVPRTGSFPYGDEREVPSNPPPVERQAVALSPDDAVQWTAAGAILSVTGKANGGNPRDAQFEPYGDTPTRKSLAASYAKPSPDEAQSWTPTLKEDKPSQYSFLYPLKRQDPNASGRASPTDSSAETSSAAVRTSPTSREMQEDESENPDVSNEMVKEVEELSDFVKRYEQKKSIKKQKELELSQRFNEALSRRPHPIEQTSSPSQSPTIQVAAATSAAVPLATARLLQASEKRQTSRFAPSVKDSPVRNVGGTTQRGSPDDDPRGSTQSRGMQPTSEGRKIKPVVVPKASDFYAPRAMGPDTSTMDDEDDLPYNPVVYGSFESSSDSGDDSEAESLQSQRLGIQRFSVQKPPAPLLSFKSPKQETREEAAPVVAPQAATRKSPKFMRQFRSSEPPLVEENRLLTDEENVDTYTGRASPKGSAEKQSPFSQPEELTPKKKGGRKGVLSSLRGNKAMMDTPFDEVTEAVAPPSQVSRSRGQINISPHTRSKNKSFNNIMTMFESKPKTPIVPSSETWQYNS